MVLPQQLRKEVWMRHNGDRMTGTCFVCNTKTEFVNFEAGHIISKAKGGSDTVENLRPICGSCNKSMGTRDLLDFKNQYFTNGRNGNTFC